MLKNTSTSFKIFTVCNFILLGFLGLICILPFINLIAISFSEGAAATANLVKLLPVNFTLSSYKYVFLDNQIIRSFGISLLRVVLAVPITLIVTILVSYPLTKTSSELRGKKIYLWFFLIPMLFSGGLVPSYIVVTTLLQDTIWTLILPGAVQMFNIVILLNFFKAIPKDIEEAANIDGAGYFTVLIKVILPLSTPALATIVLFVFVGNWNSWFDGMLYMSDPTNYPLQTYLQTILAGTVDTSLNASQINLLSKVGERTTDAAVVIISMVPIIIIYPVISRYFKTGITIGGVKG